ncbi:unnamed protein product [Clonostachys chloroleuca]|uniref:Cellulose-binding protein n=1 Tax=Clonostachys chloroleuca TaxID=1926264 RepID=A0AA35LSK6_9HYPO|nr:unnamed protein product [Clonostachys chloroleuca]
MGNEPDDQMSFVRLLTYSNELNICGIAAVTSTWLKNTTNAATIRTIIEGYGKLTKNFNANVPAGGKYPASESLLKKVTSGHPIYGLTALEQRLSEAASALIRAIDESSTDDPLWVTIWGGANVLAEALPAVTESRDMSAIAEFVSKLRIYAISDQDDAGLWIRNQFPKLFFIVSYHGFSSYQTATWVGISGEHFYHFDNGGPDTSIVTNDWHQKHIRVGELGKHYPNFTAIMEGDTPSFLPLIQNGLGDPNHPEWGSWGGRYDLVDKDGNDLLYSDMADLATGVNGELFVSKFASIWRWRKDYQFDFAARMKWSQAGNKETLNHHPVAVLNGTCGPTAWKVSLAIEDSVVLYASQSWDPDNDELEFDWSVYPEVTQDAFLIFPQLGSPVIFEALDTANSKVKASINPGMRMMFLPENNSNTDVHIILHITDKRDMGLTSYRRIILQLIFESVRD